MRHVQLLVLSLALGTWAAGCDFSPYGYCDPVDIPGSTPTGEAPVDEQPLAKARQVAEILPRQLDAIDLLFVIDDSLSMADEQEQLGRWSSELFDVLSLAGELPDLHVAVVSSSITVPGVEGCESASDGYFHTGGAYLGGDRFLRDGFDGRSRVRNYQGSLTDAFALMARVGDSGCGFEQPFEAARRALSGTLPGTEGFVRDEALLVVVFVTDEDDCSMTNPAMITSDPWSNACSPMGAWTGYRCFEFGVRCTDGKGARQFGLRSNCRPDESSPYIASVSSFATFLERLKDHPGQLMVAAIYGKPHTVVTEQDDRYPTQGTPRLRPACESDTASATPGIRINAMLSRFPARAVQSSICEPDLAWGLRDTALLAHRVATRSPCLIGPVADTDAIAAGIQASCRAYSIVGKGAATELRTEIPPCGGERTARCFSLEHDATSCADTASQLAVRVPPLATRADETVTVECDVAAPAVP